MSGTGPGEVALLRDAAALVFVEDLGDPAASAEDAHHLLGVLRLRDGATVIASDGTGTWQPCRLLRRSGAGTRQRPGASLEPTGEPRRDAQPERRGVGFAIPKGERGDWAVQKLTELGVDEIWPFVAHRSVVRLEGDDSLRRGDRYRRIAREAAAQSRRPRLPAVHDPTGFEGVVEGLSPLGAVALAEPGARPPGGDLAAILVGPEGGWSFEESDSGLRRVSLGSGVLRTETAAVVAGCLLAGSRSGILTLGAVNPQRDGPCA